MNQKTFIALAALVLALISLSGSIFVVTPANQALVVQFGEIKRTVSEPGLHFKYPLIQNLVFMERRVLDLDLSLQPEVLLADQRRLQIDVFIRYQIDNPSAFYTSVRNENNLTSRMGAILNSAVREVLSQRNLAAVLSEERKKVMTEILSRVTAGSQSFGIKIIDVRIRRADLPPQTSGSLYQRMNSELQRNAAELRAKGQELNQQIRARADRDRTVLLADAQSKAQIMRGEGDQQKIAILADAANKDPEFYAFYRSLEAYRTAIGTDTTLVLSPTSPFFRYFNEPKIGP